MKRVFARAFALWLPLAVAITGAFAFAHIEVQQSYRQGANDPQIQMAEDGAVLLTKTNAPAALIDRTQAPIDISSSLAPWIAVYDEKGTPLESNAMLDGAPPKFPQGVFDTSAWNAPIVGHHLNRQPANENRFSWQPQPGVRQAVVLVHTNDGRFVAAGRSLREVEQREFDLTLRSAILWGFTELATLVTTIVLVFLGWI